MPTVRQFLSVLILVAGFAATAVYTTSCSKKDPCSGVDCKNGTSCKSGSCACTAGLGGNYCEIVYRTQYSNIYVGTGTDNESPSRTFNNYRVTMSYNNDAVYSGMTMLTEVVNGAGNYVTHFSAPIVLTTFTSQGSAFTITPTVNKNGFLISGTGTISPTVIAMTVTETDTATSGNILTPIVYTFGTLNVQ